MSVFAFAGQNFDVIGQTALLWRQQQALIVADLHLEKASWFASKGQMLPPYDSLATLERLAGLIAQTKANVVWCLGDNFHDDNGPARMTDAAREKLAGLTAQTDWRWITGNHDENLPDGIGGTILEEADVAGLILRHRAEPLEFRPELSGHWHPKVRAVARGRGVTRPCFVMGQNRLILPAFGAFTGGMDAADPAITALTGKAEALVGAKDRVVRLPL